MLKYKFDKWNIEIVDPLVSFDKVDAAGDPIIDKVDKAAMTIDVSILMTTPNGTRFGYNLDEIEVKDLTYTTAENVMKRVIIRLEDFVVP